jgi:hypothetical protein
MHPFTSLLVIAAALGAGCAGNPGYSQGAYYDGSGPYQDGQQGWVARGGGRDDRGHADRDQAKTQRTNQKTTHAATQSPKRTSAPAAKTGGDDHK